MLRRVNSNWAVFLVVITQSTHLYGLELNPDWILCGGEHISSSGAASSQRSSGGVWANPAASGPRSYSGVTVSTEVFTGVKGAAQDETSPIYGESQSSAFDRDLAESATNIEVTALGVSVGVGACRSVHFESEWDYTVSSPETREFQTYRWAGRESEVFKGVGGSVSFPLARNLSVGGGLTSVSIDNRFQSSQYIEYGPRSSYLSSETLKTSIRGQKFSLGISFNVPETVRISSSISNVQLWASSFEQSQSIIDTTDFFQGTISSTDQVVTGSRVRDDSMSTLSVGITITPASFITFFSKAQAPYVDSWTDSSTGLGDISYSYGLALDVQILVLQLSKYRFLDPRKRGFADDSKRKRFFDQNGFSGGIYVGVADGYMFGMQYRKNTRLGRGRYLSNTDLIQELKNVQETATVSISRRMSNG